MITAEKSLVRYLRGRWRVLRGQYTPRVPCYDVQVLLPYGTADWVTVDRMDYLGNARAIVRAYHHAECNWTDFSKNK